MSDTLTGRIAPDFDLATNGGGRVRLRDLQGRKVVVYFYPADDTQGCTIEAIDFTKAATAFKAADTEIIGISPDDEASHDRFAAKHGLGITLAADPDHKAIEAYGVWGEKTMYGRKFMGVERATFLIGTDGRIANEWRKVRVAGHVDKVLATAQAL
jgi:peroxiredoxin Q/BCP